MFSRLSFRLSVLAISGLTVVMPSLAQSPSAPPKEAKVPTPSTPAKPEHKPDQIYLLDQANKLFNAVDRIELPQRVYLKKTKMDGVYQQFLSGKNGKLSVPERVLLSSSVVRGDRLGGSKDRFYYLTKEGNWRRTDGPEVYFVQDDKPDRREYILTPGEDRK